MSVIIVTAVIGACQINLYLNVQWSEGARVSLMVQRIHPSKHNLLSNLMDCMQHKPLEVFDVVNWEAPSKETPQGTETLDSQYLCKVVC